MKTPLTLLGTLILAALVGCGGVAKNPVSSIANPPSTPSSPGSTTTSDPSTSATGTPAAPAENSEGIPRSTHVFLVIEENQSFTTIYSNNTMPFLNSLASTYAHAANYTSNSGGSMLDYLWLSSGSSESSFGCQGWGCPQTITDDNIFRELTKAGLTWKVYAQSLPYSGYMDDSALPYVKRHNPAAWYSDVVDSPDLQKNMVPFPQFATDMANGTLPNYSIIIPDVNNDAHDGTPTQADAFLWSQVQPVFKLPMFNAGGDALMFITFDECGGGTNDGCGAHVLTTVIGPNVKKRYVSQTAYSHPNVLRTIMDALGVNVYPGASATAQPMTDFFQ